MQGIGSGANSAHRYRRLAEKARRLQCGAAIPETRAGSSSALGTHESCCPEKRKKAVQREASGSLAAGTAPANLPSIEQTVRQQTVRLDDLARQQGH
jgi:hypothetical protein